MGIWKAVQLNLNKQSDPPIEIYHLGNDEGEEDNVASTHKDQVDLARQIFENAHTPSPLWVFGKRPARR